MKTIDSAGARIHFLDEGHGFPVLLMHAFPLQSAMFASQVKALASRWRFILPDHRGFGKSQLPAWAEGPPAATEMAQLAADAIAVLDALNIPEAVIGGVSMGGYATMALLRAHPERARAIVLIDTQQGDDDEPGRARRHALADAALASGMTPIVEAFLPRLLRPDTPEPLRAEVEAMMRATDPRGAAAALRGLALRPDSRDVLAAFPRPALVAVGAADAITGPDKARQMAEALPRARLAEIPGAGHLASMEAPEPFNAALDAFLKETTGIRV